MSIVHAEHVNLAEILIKAVAGQRVSADWIIERQPLDFLRRPSRALHAGVGIGVSHHEGQSGVQAMPFHISKGGATV